MALILQLESSTDICSVAISRDGRTLHTISSDQPNSHSAQMTILIQQCLVGAGISIWELDAVSVSDGPGSYTSLRVGISTAKGICYAIQCPLIAIDSLSILTAGLIQSKMIHRDDLVIPMIDARRMEVYSCIFDAFGRRLSDIAAMVLDDHSFVDLFLVEKNIHLCGSGAEKYYKSYKNHLMQLHFNTTSAAFMTTLSHSAYEMKEFRNVAYYSPNYFKAPNITKSLKNLFDN